MTAFLASVRNAGEAAIALAAGADIIDAKEPVRGALGAVAGDELAAIIDAVRRRALVSATIGDHPMDPDIIAEAVEARVAVGADYIKFGVFREAGLVACAEAAVASAHKVVRQSHDLQFPRAAFKTTRYSESHTADAVLPEWSPTPSSQRSQMNAAPPFPAVNSADTKIIAVFFADFAFTAPLLTDGVMAALACIGLHGIMLDTAGKASGRLTMHATSQTLGNVVSRAHNHGLRCGLAGSLRYHDIAGLLPTKADFLGFRGGLCANGDRTGAIDAAATAAVRRAIPRRPLTTQHAQTGFFAERA